MREERFDGKQWSNGERPFLGGSLLLYTEKASGAESQRPLQVELRSGNLSRLALKWGQEARDRKSGSRRWQGSRQETGRVWTRVFVVGTDATRDVRDILLTKPDSFMFSDKVPHCRWRSAGLVFLVLVGCAGNRRAGPLLRGLRA